MEEEGRAGLEGKKTGFIVPMKEKKDQDESEEESEEDEDDNEAVGPMPPPLKTSFVKEGKKEKAKSQKDDEEDSGDESEGEDVPENSSVDRIPWSHEIKLNHGEK